MTQKTLNAVTCLSSLLRMSRAYCFGCVCVKRVMMGWVHMTRQGEARRPSMCPSIQHAQTRMYLRVEEREEDDAQGEAVLDGVGQRGHALGRLVVTFERLEEAQPQRVGDHEGRDVLLRDGVGPTGRWDCGDWGACVDVRFCFGGTCVCGWCRDG